MHIEELLEKKANDVASYSQFSLTSFSLDFLKSFFLILYVYVITSRRHGYAIVLIVLPEIWLSAKPLFFVCASTVCWLLIKRKKYPFYVPRTLFLPDPALCRYFLSLSIFCCARDALLTQNVRIWE